MRPAIPYRVGDHVIVDVRQIVPLPEAADYQVRVRRKERQRERAQRDGRDFTRYHIVVDGQESDDVNKRNAMRLMITSLHRRGVRASEMQQILHPRVFRSVQGVYEDPDLTRAAFMDADPRIDIGRFYYEHPMVEDGVTWIMTRMWGTDTESSLAALRDNFSAASVNYRRAD